MLGAERIKWNYSANETCYMFTIKTIQQFTGKCLLGLHNILKNYQKACESLSEKKQCWAQNRNLDDFTYLMSLVSSRTPKNTRKPFFDVVRGYRKKPVAWNGLKKVPNYFWVIAKSGEKFQS